MRTGIIGTKIGSTSYFNEDGSITPVTVVKVDDCIVSKIKTKDKDGYNAIQLVSIENNLKLYNVNKPQRKIFTSLDIKPKRVIKEFRVLEENLLKVGTTLDVSHFQKNQIVDVTGVSIGKGFAGSMKRHNFSGLRASHGVSVSHRSHGSTGNSQDPGKVFKGKKMAGHMGAKQVTKQNLKIIDVDQNNKLISIKGSVPGKKNAVVFIKDAIKKN
jgi:large subunit ribosomal protein L3